MIKLRFEKNDNGDVNTQIINDDETIYEFSYLDFINVLYENNNIDSSDFVGKFTEVEKEKINDMVEKINLVIKECMTEQITEKTELEDESL